MMNDLALRDHLTIVALLPDFVLGKLDEANLRRVSRHLEVCSTCRGESANAMNVLGLLAAIPPPPSWLRGAIMRRVIAESPAADRQYARRAKTLVYPSASWKPVSDEGRRRGIPFGRPVPRWALTMASASVLLASGLVGWTYEQRNEVTLEDRIYAMVNAESTAHPLEDSDLSVSATGVVFAEPTGREVYLVANNMPVLPPDQRYQIWMFTIEDEQISAGLVPVGANGEVRAFIETPSPFASYVGVALTVEPMSGSPSPTSAMVLGGAFPALSAAHLAAPARILPAEASA
jgi:anti-sigma-K factor RskA